MAQWVEGKKGGWVLLLSGFKYTRMRVNKDGTMLYVCFDRNRTKCSALVRVSEDYEILKMPNRPHVHDPQHAENEARLIINDTRKRIREDSITPVPRHFEQARKRICTHPLREEICEALGNFRKSKFQLYNVRSKLVRPEPKSALEIELTEEYSKTLVSTCTY